jgi:hypothetical protein
MKKMFLIMAVLLLVAPAMAEVKITCTQGRLSQDDVITVSYDATSEANLPRAFALDITLVDTVDVDNAVIAAVTEAVAGESAVGNRGYGIFLGSDGIDINATTGAIEYGRGFGSPAANAGDPCAATGIGTKAVTIELGSLYGGVQGVSNPNAPAQSGTLCTFRVNRKVANVVVTLNQRRGGIVMEDPDQVVDVNLPGVGATVAFAIKTPGDINGKFNGPPDNIVDGWDYNRVTAYWNQTVPPAPVLADVNGKFNGPPDGKIDGWDLSYVTGRWNQNWK